MTIMRSKHGFGNGRERSRVDASGPAWYPNGGGVTMTGEMLTVKEAAMYLRTSAKTVYLLIRAGRLPAVNVARPGSPRPQWRVSRNTLDSLSKGERVRPEAAPSDRLTEEAKTRELLHRKWDLDMHVGTPIVAWRCTICGAITFIPELATRGLNWPLYCSACGAKTSLDTLELHGRYEAAQPWAEAKPARRRRASRKEA